MILLLADFASAATADRWQRLSGGPEGARVISLAWADWGGERVLAARGDQAVWRLEGREWKRLAWSPSISAGPLADPAWPGVAWLEGSRLAYRNPGDRKPATRALPWPPSGAAANAHGLWLWGAAVLHAEHPGARPTRHPGSRPDRVVGPPADPVRLEGGRLLGRDGVRATGVTDVVECGGLWVLRDQQWQNLDDRAALPGGPAACADPGTLVAGRGDLLEIVAGSGTVRLAAPTAVSAVAATVVAGELRLAVAGADGAIHVGRRPWPPPPAAAAPASEATEKSLRPLGEVLAAVADRFEALRPAVAGAAIRARRAAWVPDLQASAGLSGGLDEGWRQAPGSALSTSERIALIGPVLTTVDAGASRDWSAGLRLDWSLDGLVWSRDELSIWRQWERDEAERERRAGLAASLWHELADRTSTSADRARAEAVLRVLTGGASPWLDD